MVSSMHSALALLFTLNRTDGIRWGPSRLRHVSNFLEFALENGRLSLPLRNSYFISKETSRQRRNTQMASPAKGSGLSAVQRRAIGTNLHRRGSISNSVHVPYAPIDELDRLVRSAH